MCYISWILHIRSGWQQDAQDSSLSLRMGSLCKFVIQREWNDRRIQVCYIFWILRLAPQNDIYCKKVKSKWKYGNDTWWLVKLMKMGTDLYKFWQFLSQMSKTIVVSTVRVVFGLDLLNGACRCQKSFLWEMMKGRSSTCERLANLWWSRPECVSILSLISL